MFCIVVQLNELMDPESGFLGREGLIVRVDVLECCPWFEFADLETYTSGEYHPLPCNLLSWQDSCWYFY